MTTEAAAEVQPESAPVEDQEVTPAEVEGSEPSEQAAEQEAPATSEPEHSEGAQEAINRQHRKFRDEQRRADAAERELEALRADTAPKLKDVPAPVNEDALGYDPEAVAKAQAHRDGVIDHNARVKGAEEERQRSADAQALASMEQATSAYHDRLDTYWEKNPDSKKRFSDIPPLQKGIANAILRDDNGPAIMDHLLQRLDVVDRLNTMDSHSATMELGRISVAIGTKPKPKTTDAPAPITTLDGGGALPDDMAKYNDRIQGSTIE